MLFLALEMNPRRSDRLFEKPLRLRQVPGFPQLAEVIVDLPMILIKPFKLAAIFKDMIQREVGKIVFRVAVVVQKTFNHPAQKVHFAQRLQFGQLPLDLVEKATKNSMLHYQSFRNSQHTHA